MPVNDPRTTHSSTHAPGIAQTLAPWNAPKLLFSRAAVELSITELLLPCISPGYIKMHGADFVYYEGLELFI